jgi:hypothetical protein
LFSILFFKFGSGVRRVVICKYAAVMSFVNKQLMFVNKQLMFVNKPYMCIGVGAPAGDPTEKYLPPLTSKSNFWEILHFFQYAKKQTDVL